MDTDTLNEVYNLLLLSVLEFSFYDKKADIFIQAPFTSDKD